MNLALAIIGTIGLAGAAVAAIGVVLDYYCFTSARAVAWLGIGIILAALVLLLGLGVVALWSEI